MEVEVSEPAVATGLKHPRDTVQTADQRLCELPEWPTLNATVSAQVIEHLSAERLQKLLDNLDGIHNANIDSPIPAINVQHSWKGHWDTHALEIGWEHLEANLCERNLRVLHRDPESRWLVKPPAMSPTSWPNFSITLLHVLF